MELLASRLAGANPSRGRVENDYYATNPESTKALLRVWSIEYPALEPACGEGHISKLLEKDKTESYDLIDRGYGITGVDFLTTKFDKKFNTVITNPPFKLFREFVEKSLEVSNKHVIMFGKLQALEGIERATYFETTPLKYVYVFKKRQQPLRDGTEIDPTTNKKMNSSTMAFAWFIWEKEYKGEPIIIWI